MLGHPLGRYQRLLLQGMLPVPTGQLSELVNDSHL